MRCPPGVTVLLVGNGTARNALCDEGWDELTNRAEAIAADRAVRAVLVQGSGADFCSGSDLRYWRGAPPAAVDASFAAMERALRAVEAIPVPVVAAVRGVAAGAGCQLALACDIRFAARDARIGMPIAELGILASASFAERLIRAGGAAGARLVLLGGGLLDSEQARELGLVDRCADAGELDDIVASTLAELARAPRPAVVAAKHAIRLALAPVTGAAQTAGPTTVEHSVFDPAMEAFAARSARR